MSVVTTAFLRLWPMNVTSFEGSMSPRESCPIRRFPLLQATEVPSASTARGPWTSVAIVIGYPLGRICVSSPSWSR